MTIGSELELRPARRARLSTADQARDDLLAFLQLAAHDFGEAAVADPERDVDGLRLALGVEDVHASRRGDLSGAARGAARRHLVVLGLLLRRQQRADLHPRRLTDLLCFGPALAFGQLAQPHHLLAALLEDGVELGLLVRGEGELLDQPLADLLERGPPAAFAAALRRRAAAEGRAAARGAGGGRR